MNVGMVARVRRFSRTYTQRVGALEARYLGRDRPLGEARVLWEIGDGGRDVRALRRDLDLDSGYLSRLLRSLEADGLVTIAPSEADRRVRTARLTAAGRAERDLLDRRADELAASLLAPLSDGQRARLVEALAEVERLLAAADVSFAVVDSESPDAQRSLQAYYEELDRRFPGGFDIGRSLHPSAGEMRPPKGTFVVATLHGEPVGCGGLVFQADEPPTLKRMWVAPAARGLGIGRRLLAALEGEAAAHGYDAVRLETNATLTEAIALYRSAGYREVPAFNAEPYGDHWFERSLGTPAAAPRDGDGDPTG